MPIRSQDQYKLIVAKILQYGIKDKIVKRQDILKETALKKNLNSIYIYDFDNENNNLNDVLTTIITTMRDDIDIQANAEIAKLRTKLRAKNKRVTLRQKNEIISEIEKKILTEKIGKNYWVFKKDMDPRNFDYGNVIKNVTQEKKGITEILFNMLGQDIKNFDEYKQEAEKFDTIYVEMVKNYNYYNNDLNEDFFENYYNFFYNENASVMTVNVLKKLFKAIADKEVTNENGITKVLGDYLNSEENLNEIRDKYIKTGLKNSNQSEEEITKIVDNYMKKYKEMDTDEKIKTLVNELTNIKQEEYGKYFFKIFNFNDQKSADKLRTELNNLSQKINLPQNLKKLFDLFVNVINHFSINFKEVEDQVRQEVDMAGEDKSDKQIKLITIYNILKSINGLEHIYRAMKINEDSLAGAMDSALAKYGTHGGGSEKQLGILNAKKAAIAYITISSVLKFANSLSQQKLGKEPQEPQEEQQVIPQEKLQGELFKRYGEEIYSEAMIRPIAFAKAKLTKIFTITDFKELLANNGTFKKEVLKYFQSVPSSLRKLEQVLSTAGIEIRYDYIANMTRKGFKTTTVNLTNAEKDLNIFLKNRSFIKKVTEKLLQAYKVKQSLGAKLGTMAKEAKENIQHYVSPVEGEE